MNSLSSLLTGFAASSSLIIAIGAQNAFVIRQGLRQQHLLMTALVCSLIDALLIMLGIVGLGHVIGEFPALIDFIKYFSVLFLFFYGALALKSAFYSSTWNDLDEERTSPCVQKTIITLLALSLLNPHVYLDTVILLGSIAMQQPLEERFYFALGAISASFVWFFALAYGTSLLRPFLQSPKIWKMIDTGMGCLMWGIAFQIIK